MTQVISIIKTYNKMQATVSYKLLNIWQCHFPHRPLLQRPTAPACLTSGGYMVSTGAKNNSQH